MPSHHDPSPSSPEAARYWEARWEKKRPLVELGMADLSLWLRDQITMGFEQLRRGGAEPVRALASRMLNVECKGIAERLDRLAGLLGTDEERPPWEGRAQVTQPSGAEERLDAQLLAFGELALLSRSFERLARLSFEQRVSLLSELGLREEPKSARVKPALKGRWVALSQQVERARGLIARRQWLARLPTVSERQRALHTQGAPAEPNIPYQREAIALTLDYVWGSAPLPPLAPLGGVISQDLRPFEGPAPRRALIYPIRDEDISGSAERAHLTTHERPSLDEWAGLPWSLSIAHSREGFERQVIEAPWRPIAPALLSGGRVIASRAGGLSYLDRSGAYIALSLPVQPALQTRAERALLCVGGQSPVSLIGEWRPDGLRALSLVSGRGRLYSITGGRLA